MKMPSTLKVTGVIITAKKFTDRNSFANNSNNGMAVIVIPFFYPKTPLSVEYGPTYKKATLGVG
jgi:hypothetical protein